MVVWRIGHRAPPGRGALAIHAALLLATATLPRLAHLPFLFHRGLLIITTTLDLLKDAFLRHLLLQDLHRLLDRVANLHLERSAKQCLQEIVLRGREK